ncbi:MFS transporter [Mycetocola reblochoni]|uniref:MFS transporter n=2 Tax=Mycetocola reblochoni TaxID=331618 RepID=A0A3L6ZQW0_9MICO|nr:MFS transporter [Mycetocola reblochoni]
MLPVLLVSVDNTVLHFALPEISEELRPSASELLWMVDIYPLILAGLLVSMGSLGDRIGRRRLLLIGATGFAAVSIVAAFAPSPLALIGARAALGFFGAMLMPSTLSLLRNLFLDARQRRLAIAVWASGFAAGSALGPIVGGLLLEHFWWGSVFLLAVPVLVPLLVTAPFLIPDSKDPHPGPVDPVSIVLSLLAMVPLVYAIKEFASEGVTAAVIASVLVGTVSGVLFVRRQLRRPSPMLDVRLFRLPQFSSAILVNLLSVVALSGGLLFITQHLQLVLGLSPIQSGLVMLPGLVTMILAGLLVVPIAGRIRPRFVIPVAMLFTISGYLMVALAGVELSQTDILVAFILLGLGIGAAETVSNDLVIATAPASKAGAASAVSETAYELGSVLGTAVLGTVLMSAYRQNVVLPEGLTAADQAAAGETLGGAVSVSQGLGGEAGAELLHSAQLAFDSGIAPTAAIGVAVVAAAAVIAFLGLRRVGLDGAKHE